MSLRIWSCFRKGQRSKVPLWQWHWGASTKKTAAHNSDLPEEKFLCFYILVGLRHEKVLQYIALTLKRSNFPKLKQIWSHLCMYYWPCICIYNHVCICANSTLCSFSGSMAPTRRSLRKISLVDYFRKISVNHYFGISPITTEILSTNYHCFYPQIGSFMNQKDFSSSESKRGEKDKGGQERQFQAAAN